MTTHDRPTGPGLWTREGKFYRIAAHEDGYLFAWQIILDDGTEWAVGPAKTLPSGNWRKLSGEGEQSSTAKSFLENLPKLDDPSVVEALAIACGEDSPSPDVAAAEREFREWLGATATEECDASNLECCGLNTIAAKATEIYGRVTEGREFDQIAGLKQIIARQDQEIRELKALNQTVDQENKRLLKAIADDQPNGRWLDRHGACRVCGGEIPHGHTLDCDHYKLEKEVKTLTAEWKRKAEELQTLSDRRNRELAEIIEAAVRSGWDGKGGSKAIAKRLEAKQPAEVIEGRGQAVTEAGYYACEPFPAIQFKGEGVFHQGYRYIKIEPPTFPPRPSFVAPPKPETIDLNLQCPIGSMVKWKTLGGKEYCGRLIEWDSNMAVVKTDNGVKAVEC